MPNPFSPDYVTATLTAGTAAAAGLLVPHAQETGVLPAAGSEANTQKFDFQPGQYGLGKPKRVVIRGKIARE